jgi:hypothetical protein
MVTVLGASLQNRDLLKLSSINLGRYWFRDGGFLLQKTIQSASKIRKVYLRTLKYDTRIMHQITFRNRKHALQAD